MSDDTDRAAPHFYTRRPIHLCTDGRDDDDEGPPNWTAIRERWADDPVWDVP